MKKLLTLLLVLPAIGIAKSEEATNLIGQKYQCFSCHGITGIPLSSRRPVLAGQRKGYLIKRLEDFRAGNIEPYNIMNQQAKSLTDSEIEALAQYFHDQGFSE